VVQQKLAAAGVVDGRGIFQYDAQVVGQLVVGELIAGGEVGLLEPQQRDSTSAGVAVGEVGQDRAD
jgi:hypothetical protein